MSFERLVPADSKLCVASGCVCVSFRLFICTSACRKDSSRAVTGNVYSRVEPKGDDFGESVGGGVI